MDVSQKLLELPSMALTVTSVSFSLLCTAQEGSWSEGWNGGNKETTVTGVMGSGNILQEVTGH